MAFMKFKIKKSESRKGKKKSKDRKKDVSLNLFSVLIEKLSALCEKFKIKKIIITQRKKEKQRSLKG